MEGLSGNGRAAGALSTEGRGLRRGTSKIPGSGECSDEQTKAHCHSVGRAHSTGKLQALDLQTFGVSLG